jgi:predicted Fe-S protein YdhL (DUF1289 family)
MKAVETTKEAGKGLSPCVGICTMESTTQLCTGCKRTLVEIAQWSQLDNAQRAAIMKRLPGRNLTP